MKPNFQICYKYRNTTDDDIELWFSKPKECRTQMNISIQSNMDPENTNEHPFLNSLWYFNLKPKEKLKVVIQYHGSLVNQYNIDELSEEEKKFFLRSTKLVPINEEIKRKAEIIIGDAQTDLEKAEKIFKHITRTYKYSTRFNARGVYNFLNKRKGDCGEFAALFCSYCRSIGIPARILYGTWTLKKFSPHSWTEIYLDGQGWIPVDPSMGRIKLYYHPLLYISTSIYYGAFSNKNRYFGNHEGKRFAFSIDPERELIPNYKDVVNIPPQALRNNINERAIAWGFESFDGNAPFLQPVYIKIHSKNIKVTNKLLFGNWKGKYLQWYDNLTYIIKTGSFTLGFVLIYFEIINEYFTQQQLISLILPLFSTPLILMGTFLSFIRKETNFLINILGINFLFYFIGLLGSYLGIN
ncbi:transglutaminase-like domain-containing protein [Fervidibacillus albus]|uniref:Transglutaminase-like domain-containing protein n=1 Tax=Fervidibacillus albus TaxID=2980026 RepID=A0A9E8LSX4_9BACI|nr:transglutaminase-like domain-containing protein [Fervidibacillus albus]WAA08795.1 transglutaminase-like domain-containing protein [Fervidibacillus albus]